MGRATTKRKRRPCAGPRTSGPSVPDSRCGASRRRQSADSTRRSPNDGRRAQLRLLRAERCERQDHDRARQWESQRQRGAVADFGANVRLASSSSLSSTTPHKVSSGCNRSRCFWFGSAPTTTVPWADVPSRKDALHHAGRPRLTPPSLRASCVRLNPLRIRRHRHRAATGCRRGRARGSYALKARPSTGAQSARIRARRWRWPPTRSGKRLLTHSKTAATSFRSRTRGRSFVFDGRRALNRPIIAAGPRVPSGRGYWLLGSTGGVFRFGERALPFPAPLDRPTSA